MRGLVAITVTTAALLASAHVARAETRCDMAFHLEGWSVFYKTAHGGGRVTCDNGQSARVVIRTKGGGVTFGKEKIVDGEGHFSPISSISEIFGDYANAEAHAGAGESSDAQVVTKGDVSLTLKGKGHGVDLGFAFGKFTIARAAPARRRVERRSEEPRREPPRAYEEREAPRPADEPPPPGTAY